MAGRDAHFVAYRFPFNRRPTLVMFARGELSGNLIAFQYGGHVGQVNYARNIPREGCNVVDVNDILNCHLFRHTMATVCIQDRAKLWRNVVGQDVRCHTILYVDDLGVRLTRDFVPYIVDLFRCAIRVPAKGFNLRVATYAIFVRAKCARFSRGPVSFAGLLGKRRDLNNLRDREHAIQLMFNSKVGAMVRQ